MKKEELENIIKEYLAQHADLNVMCDPDGDGHMKVCVSLWLDSQKIASGSDSIILS